MLLYVQVFLAWLWPQLQESIANVTAGLDGDFQNIPKNWTEAFSRLEDEDPTFTFTEAEYLPETSEVGSSVYVVIIQARGDWIMIYSKRLRWLCHKSGDFHDRWAFAYSPPWLGVPAVSHLLGKSTWISLFTCIKVYCT